MTTRQYIGARYVMKIYENSQTAGSAEWEADTSYEPLTIVTYQNSSYLSKKAVPATVGNPASNGDYWIVTGAYNGQIASLQSQIDDTNSLITALTNTRVVIKPEQFGAIGDGAIDDTQAIKDCVLYATTHYCIIALTASYRVTDQIDLFTGCRIIGGGAVKCEYNPGSIPNEDLRHAATFNCTNCHNIVIDGVTFIGTGASTTSYTKTQCVGGESCYDITVSNCIFNNIQCEGAVIFFNSHDIIVSHCSVNTYTYTGIAFWNDSYNCEVTHCKIYNGTLTGSSHVDRYPISLCGWDDVIALGHSMPTNLKANYNYIEDLTPEWEGIDAHGGKNIEVIGNIIINVAVPVAVFTDDSRHFHAYNVIIDNNICYQRDDVMDHSKLWHSASLSGDEFIVSNNQFIQDWYGNPYSTSLSDYFGISVGFKRGVIKNNLFKNIQNGCLVFTTYGGTSEVSDNYFTETTSGLATNGYAIVAGGSGAHNVRIHNNELDYIHPYNYVQSGSSLFVFIDNVYPNTFSQVTWTDLTYCIPDYCNSTELASVTANEIGHIIKNKAPSAGGILGWINTAIGVWKSIGTIEA